MLMRVYRCAVIAGREDEFRAYAFNKSHPWLREQRGLISFHAGRPLAGSIGRTRCMVQVWESEEAIKNALGDAWQQPPRLSEEVRGFIESVSVEHYELADVYASAADRPEVAKLVG